MEGVNKYPRVLCSSSLYSPKRGVSRHRFIPKLSGIVPEDQLNSNSGASLPFRGRGAKIIADHVVAAPSIPFPVGFGAKMKVATPFPFPVWGARGAPYSISALLAPKGGIWPWLVQT